MEPEESMKKFKIILPRDCEEPMEKVILEDGRYPLEAFAFLHEALAYAVEHVYGGQAEGGQEKHVSGKQLCLALRDLAIKKWGLLARTVLAKWNIHATIDFGNMVYLLVQHKIWRKRPQDSIEDFQDVFDFAEAFNVQDEFELKE